MEPFASTEQTPESKAKPRRWRFFIATLLSTVLVAGGVFGVVEATKAKGVTPANINAAMAKFCSKDRDEKPLVTFLGPQTTAKNTTIIECASTQKRVKVEAFFFRTAQEENAFLNGKSDLSMYDLGYDSVGKGVVASFACWERNCGPRMTCRQIVIWMPETFGVKPIPHGLPKQRWKQTLPPITLPSFGLREPRVFKIFELAPGGLE